MTTPTVGIALGGGGARGLAHIPVLEVLDEFGIVPTVVAGTSIGALIGSGYAAGMSGREIRAYAEEVFADSGAVLSRIWDQRPKKISELMAGMSGLSLQLNAPGIVDMFLPEAVPATFEELKIPLIAVASDYYGWQEAALSTGLLRPAIAASIAIPVLFKPVSVDRRVMIDGGAVNPLPIDQIRTRADITIGVDVVGGPKAPGNPIPKAAEVVFGASQLMMQTITREKLSHSAPDILITPNIAVFRVLDFFKIRAILRASEPVKDELRRKLDTTLKGGLPPPDRPAALPL